MVERLGFKERWLMWIRSCLVTSSISVLVNGSSSNEFNLQRGLRQGDSLAHFLFVVVVEGLNGLMRQATSKEIVI